MVDEWDDWLPDAEKNSKAPAARVRVQAKPTDQAGLAQAAPRLLVRRPDTENEQQKTANHSEPQKTLKQKEAEYAAARARIFGTSQPNNGKGGGGGGGGRGGRGQQNNRGRGRANGAEKGRGDAAVDPDYDRNRVVASMPSQCYDDGPMSQDPYPTGSSSGYAMGRGRQIQARNGQNKGPVNPAGFDDPDYSRDPRRFAPRLAPSDDLQGSAYESVPRSEPASYEDSFPALGAVQSSSKGKYPGR